MKKRNIFPITFITILIFIIAGYLVVNNRYRDNRSFWKNEVKYMCPQDSLTTGYLPFIDSLNDIIIIHYKSVGDEFYKYIRTLIIIKSSNKNKLIYYDRENIKTDHNLSIVQCDSIFDSRYVDSLFSLLGKNMLPLRSLFSGNCFGCESYLAYTRINGTENAIAWETDELKFYDFKYKKLSGLFQSALKDCETKMNTKARSVRK